MWEHFNLQPGKPMDLQGKFTPQNGRVGIAQREQPLSIRLHIFYSGPFRSVPVRSGN